LSFLDAVKGEHARLRKIFAAAQAGAAGVRGPGCRGALGLSKAALADRKRKDSFPVDRLKALAHDRPELKIDVDYVLNGIDVETRETRARYSVGHERARAKLRSDLGAAPDAPALTETEALAERERLHEAGGFPVRTDAEKMVGQLAVAARECEPADLAAMLQLALSLARKAKG